MSVPFIKMHGLGNDFVVFDHRQRSIDITPQIAAKLADRRLGVGCDQIVQITAPRPEGVEAHAQMLIFNADGSQAEMCGNAARCVAKYLRQILGLQDNILTLQTLAGPIMIKPAAQGLEAVDMGKPTYGQPDETITTALGASYKFTEVSMGNPHCVIFVPEVLKFPLAVEGEQLETHVRFPNRTNVEFVQVLSADHIRMRVWERGVGITPACGTGACAAAVAAIINGLTARELTVTLDGGDLAVNWQNDDHVIMTGPANESFRGEINF